ncbi:MAG: hypothetical protein ACQESR_13685 [Planctomycetota bacterium]
MEEEKEFGSGMCKQAGFMQAAAGASGPPTPGSRLLYIAECGAMNGASEDLSGYVPDFNFILSDFSAAGSPEFRGHSLLQAIPRVFHRLPAGNLRAELERIMLLWNGLTDGPIGRRLFRAMLEYIFRADNTLESSHAR